MSLSTPIGGAFFSPSLSLIASLLRMEEIFGRGRRATVFAPAFLRGSCQMTHFGHFAFCPSPRRGRIVLLAALTQRLPALFSEFGWGCCVQNYT